MRWFHDFSSMSVGLVAAFLLSMRCRTIIRAVVWSLLSVPVLVVLVLGPDVAWLVVRRAFGSGGLANDVQLYWTVTLTVLAVRWGVVCSAVGRCARRFDAYVLGERPESEGRRKRRHI
jgi:hypothetical protein